MKLIDLLRSTRVDEAPLGDYQTIGNWGDKDKANSFNHAVDRKMIAHPNVEAKMRQKLGNTEHLLNMYFVNLPGARKFAETGVVEPEFIAQAMPTAWPEIQQGTNQGEAVNVIYVGNAGVNRVPMTPWIMAHRLGHAIQASYRQSRGFNVWKEYEEDAAMFFSDCLEGVYDWTIPKQNFWSGGFDRSQQQDKLLAKFFEGIGGMRSARQGKLGGRAYEFLYEMFAQFITTGRLTFRDCPPVFGMRGGPQYRIQDQDTAAMWNRSFNDEVGDHIGGRIDNCLYDMEGKFLIM
jgi:hypothetical protein